jgi:predicted dehydrogenase
LLFLTPPHKPQKQQPNDVKAYGDPAALAADPNINLIVVCTRVDIHASVIEPNLRAGKAVYIE